VSERTFGVEIEFGTPFYEEEIEKALNRAIPGFEECWSPYPDGTAYEVHTPPLQGEEGFDTLARIFTVLREECDGYVTEEDGMHVHFGARDYADKPAILARAVRSWINLEPVLNKFIVPYRRGGFWACGDFTRSNTVDLPKDLRKIKSKKSGKKGYYVDQEDRKLYPGRRKLNIDHVVAAAQFEEGGYKSTPTLEVRSHEGTLAIKEATAWIKMLLAFFDYHTNRPSLPKLRRPETLLERLRVDDETGATLLDKALRFDRGEYSFERSDDYPEYDDYDEDW
jgi:hypothetical protein